MPQGSARAIKRFRLVQRHIDDGIDKFEELAIRRFLVKIVSLVADCVAPAALHTMIVVIEHFLKGPAIDHGLVAFETFALLAFERFNSNGTKFDSLNSAPSISIAFENFDSIPGGFRRRVAASISARPD